MQGKIKMILPITTSDYEVLRVLQEHCFTITDTKLIENNNLMLEIEVFSNLNIDTDFGGDFL